MHYIFYLLELISPQQYSGMPLEAPVMRFEEDYRKMDSEVACMARIVYNEAYNQSHNGKVLVAQTTMNRLKDKRFPDTVCGNLKVRGAFSFFSPKTKDRKRVYPSEVVEIAEKALQGHYDGVISSNVKYFKQCKHNSSFFNKLRMIKREQDHCFYAQQTNDHR